MTVILILNLQGDSPEEYLARVSRPIPDPTPSNPIKMCTEVASTACDETFATPNQSPHTTEEENECKFSFSFISRIS